MSMPCASLGNCLAEWRLIPIFILIEEIFYQNKSWVRTYLVFNAILTQIKIDVTSVADNIYLVLFAIHQKEEWNIWEHVNLRIFVPLR